MTGVNCPCQFLYLYVIIVSTIATKWRFILKSFEIHIRGITMEKILSVLKTIYNFVAGLSIEHITLLSVLVTLIIFVSDKRKDIKTAQLEARREEYKKFIQLLEKFSTGKVKIDGNSRKEFFDAGVSLLLYGSKKVYKKYIFFRDYTTNPVIQNSKHNKSEVLLYVVADILKAIRHEVGLTSFGDLSSNEALAFFVNDIGMNSASKVQAYRAKYHIFMLKVELFALDRYNFVLLKKFYYYLLKPIFGLLVITLKFLIFP